MVTIIGLVIGILVLVGGLYYLIKEKDDKESRNIYLVATLIGVVITVVCVLKLFVL